MPPLYEYVCSECKHTFDIIHSYSRTDPVECEECSSTDTQKVIHAPAVNFVGEGFYINDVKRDAKEAVKRKFEGKAYRPPEARGDSERYAQTSTPIMTPKSPQGAKKSSEEKHKKDPKTTTLKSSTKDPS